jgi:hypothetical protein
MHMRGFVFSSFRGSSLMRRVVLVAFALVVGSGARAFAGERYGVIITGAAGGDAYEQKYQKWRTAFVTTLRDTFRYRPDSLFVLGETEADGVRKATRDNVRALFSDLRRRMTKDDQALVLLIGHGTTLDGEEAKFNLVGPDLSATEWADLVKPLAGRVVFVNASSASFPFLRKLAARGRVVLTATDSSAQHYETVFPEFFINAFGDTAADVDKNGRVSVWEAFNYASAAVKQFYEQKGQLPTERALLDDTGTGLGREADTPGNDGAVARVTYVQPDAILALPSDASLATLVQRQAELQSQLENLKARKESTPADQYDAELEKLLVELARVSIQIRAKS